MTDEPGVSHVPKGVNLVLREDFIDKYPVLFHMAAAGSWDSIRYHGLLSTSCLVDLYAPPPSVRRNILEGVRHRSYTLQAAGRPDATVRDQLPLKFLPSCLLPGVSVQDFLDELNTRVFFHVSRDRLERLLSARAYRKLEHDVISVDTSTFLGLHHAVDLAPYNTGSVHVPNMPARGPQTFVRIEDYPWEEWKGRRGRRDAVAELSVKWRASVAGCAVRVERWSAGRAATVIWRQ